jgi:hypothetical protein
MTRLIPRQKRRSTLRSIATLAGVSTNTVHDVLSAQTALILEDLAAGRGALLPGIGRLRWHRGSARIVSRDGLRCFLAPGKIKAVIKPGKALGQILRQLGEVFE